FYLREGNFRRGTRICYAITLCFVMRLIRLRAKTAPQDSNADFEKGAECLINFAAESSLEQRFAQLVADSLFFPLLAPFPRLFARAVRSLSSFSLCSSITSSRVIPRLRQCAICARIVCGVAGLLTPPVSGLMPLPRYCGKMASSFAN